MNSGNVTVNSSGTIGVGGDNGAGINLQAIGGGGGTIKLHSASSRSHDDRLYGPAAARCLPATLGSVDGDHNEGGDLESRHDGSIFTDGEARPGSLQTIGGGGGCCWST